MNDGHKFVNSAIRNGAICVVHCDDLATYHDDVIYIQVNDVDEELNRVASIYYDDPSSKLEVFAVTGTNGKTTVSSLIKNILNHKKSTGYWNHQYFI